MAFNKNKQIEPITDKQKLRNRALYWLSKKDYSIHDFEKKLNKVCEIEELKLALLEDFVRRDWLNEQRFMESFVRMQVSKGLGLQRIKMELKQHGIQFEQAIKHIENLNVDWFEQALNTYERKFAGKPADLKKDYKEKAKRFRFMQYRGFNPDEIKYAMEEHPDSYSNW